jgi:FkbM family methyltransferase
MNFFLKSFVAMPAATVRNQHEAVRFLVRILRSRYRDHRAELAEMRRHIRRGDLVCDIGANKGSFLYWLARWSNPGSVIAFEPQPDLAQGLSRLCAKFALNNVVVEQSAVYSSSGTQKFFIPDGHQPAASLLKPAGQTTTVEATTVSLDDYLSDHQNVAALKIDVEGTELEVLQGAIRTLNRCKPLVVFECDRHIISIDRMQETFAFLLGLGYSGAFVSEGTLLPLSCFNLDLHQKAEGEWFWKDKAYCNNFVFSKTT